MALSIRGPVFNVNISTTLIELTIDMYHIRTIFHVLAALELVTNPVALLIFILQSDGFTENNDNLSGK